MKIKKHLIERIKINKQIVAIRVVITEYRGARYSKQFVVNDHVSEREALEMAKEYIAIMAEKPVSIPSDEEVIKVVENIVEKESIRLAHNAKLRETVSKEVDFVRSRYSTTRVFGYLNKAGDFIK